MFQNKPVIGICPLYDEKKESYWMLPGYMQMLEAAGALPLMMPLTGDENTLAYYLETCDGFIIPGGQDVSPAVYGQEKLPVCGVNIPERDALDVKILRAAIALDKPVLGICQGHQILNVALGGTMYQDLKVQQGTTCEHMVPNPVGGMVHEVVIVPGSPLAALQGAETMMVNSRHHQAVRDAAPGLAVQATSPDGVIESVYLPGKRFVWGVQWHPESIWTISEENRKIAEEFLRAAR